MSDAKSVSVALVELLGSALWPGVTIVALLYFAPNIVSLLEAASKEIKNAINIEVGSVKLVVIKDNIPKPSLSISTVLTKKGFRLNRLRHV